ncbi:hypothetical protein AB1Y20_009373 [Prymnesium parvum]|uniref:Sodium/hydrogen exchanger n=1 Tax=Prymnesium parvum TaxID=97485 RepID=A0AB34K4C6_PRYPA
MASGDVQALIFALLFVVCILGSHAVIHTGFTILPESSTAILIGVLFGLVHLWVSPPESRSELNFNPEIFFSVLLPPIIFDAGYSLKRRLFFRNITPILTLAVIGTVISTAVIAVILKLSAHWGWIDPTVITTHVSLLFAALISAVDPVGTLAVLSSREVNADQMMQSIIFGESVLNDAVAIVLFQTLLHVDNPSELGSVSSIASLALDFLKVSCASTAIGVGVALSLCLLLRRYQFDQVVHLEVSLVLGAAYIAYAIADELAYSGVLALFFCGVVLAHYNWHNLSHSAKLVTGHTSKTLAYIAETIVFAYLGVAASEPSVWRDCDWNFVALGILGCLISRALNIFPLAMGLNLVRSVQIPLRMQVLLWFAGLRGAIAFALAVYFPHSSANDSAPSVILSATLIIVLSTTLVLGGLTGPLVKCLRLEATDTRTHSVSQVEVPLVEGGAAVPPPHGRLMRAWKRADSVYFREWFGGNPRAVTAQRSAPSLPAGSGVWSRRVSSRVARIGAAEGGQSVCSWAWAAHGSYADPHRRRTSSAGSDEGGGGGGGGGGAAGMAHGAAVGGGWEGAVDEREVADEIFWMIRTNSRDPFVVPPGSMGGGLPREPSGCVAWGGARAAELGNVAANGTLEPARPVVGAVAYGPIEPHRPRSITPPLRHAASYPAPMAAIGEDGCSPGLEGRDQRGREASM